MNPVTATDLRALAEQPFDLLLAIEARLRATRADLATGSSQAWTGLAFRLGGLWLLAPRDDVREVIVPPRLTRIPGARPWLLGVGNVRGNLLPVTDLGLWAGRGVASDLRAQRVLVYNSSRLPAGLLVDEVFGYRAFGPDDQRPARTEAMPVLTPHVIAGFEREGRSWAVLSLARLVQAPTFTQAGA